MAEVIYEKRGKIAVMTINRPEAHNAFTADMLRGMDAATTRTLVAALSLTPRRGFAALGGYGQFVLVASSVTVRKQKG